MCVCSTGNAAVELNNTMHGHVIILIRQFTRIFVENSLCMVHPGLLFCFFIENFPSTLLLEGTLISVVMPECQVSVLTQFKS